MNETREVTPQELLGQLNETEAKHAPERLFISGHTDILLEGARVSVVGSRKASKEGLLRARKLATLLAQNGHVVVAGLAAGIDTAAHEAAINAGGRTIAVIGTPLDKCYPKENADLQCAIRKQHLLISQFPEGYPTRPGNFPMRNRTMALISDATVIMEASDTSGSISQGWETLRLGKELFISNAIVQDNSLTWPQKMLYYGANILSDETLDEFFEHLPQRCKTAFAISF